MTDTETGPPVPVRNERTEPYFEGARDEMLMIQRCGECDAPQPPGRFVCSNCLSEQLTWEEASGAGTLYTYVVMHQPYHPYFEDRIPYNASIVELEEGPRIVSEVLADREDLQVGMELSVTFESVDEDLVLPRFRRA